MFKHKKMKDWNFGPVALFFIILGSVLMVSGVYLIIIPELNPGDFGDGLLLFLGGVLTIVGAYIHLELVLTRKMMK